MPQSRTKPSDVAQEAKKHYLQSVKKRKPGWLMGSILCPDTSAMEIAQKTSPWARPRVTVERCDPVDCAINWNDHSAECNEKGIAARRIVLVNMANEKRAGGDWESGLQAPEECFARRSTLVHALSHTYEDPYQENAYQQYPPASKFYPIPQTGGIYSHSVVVFRGGGDHYQHWSSDEYRSMSVISVAPIRGPRLDATNTDYSFGEERELMMAKMKAILRIAAYYGFKDICLGAFGVGPIFRNPARVTAEMWKSILFYDEEFKTAFENIVFAIDTSTSSSSKTSKSDFDVYTEVFDPNQLFPTTYR